MRKRGLKHGIYLAQRWASQCGGNLYHCADDSRGFFVEVGIEDEKPVVLRSSARSVSVEDYSHYVRPPDLGQRPSCVTFS